MTALQAIPGAVCPFYVGDLECASVLDGATTVPPNVLFYNAPEDALNHALAQHGLSRDGIELPFHCLLVRTGGMNVLVDAGPGPGWPGSVGQLPVHLREAGVNPEAVDVVLLSHGHADHTGGVLRPDGGLTFPNARHLLSRAERAFWMTDDAMVQAGPRRGPAARAVLEALGGRLETFDEACELLPCLTPVPAPGHTPHNLAFVISSGGETLLYVADSLAHTLHCEHPDWHLAADLDPAGAMRTRIALLDQAAAEGALVMGYHLPHPAAGHVGRAQAPAYHWEPVGGAKRAQEAAR